MDSENYNFYKVWIWKMRRLGVSEALEDEVTTTWPCQQHGRPNELKLHHDTYRTRLLSWNMGQQRRAEL